MEILILTVFVSLMLVTGELVFFAWNLLQGTHDHSDRLSLLPLEDERRTPDARFDTDRKKGN
jgi:cbb3-type cytochrome oxidase maturation protein